MNFLPYLAEYLGSFFFMLIVFATNGNPLAVGGTLAIIIYLVSAHSGAHVNPAVSVVMHMDGSLTHGKLIYYIIAQVLGALSGYYAYQMAR
jgi:glycerol uptake facilitator-like aquaporin